MISIILLKYCVNCLSQFIISNLSAHSYLLINSLYIYCNIQSKYFQYFNKAYQNQNTFLKKISPIKQLKQIIFYLGSDQIHQQKGKRNSELQLQLNYIQMSSRQGSSSKVSSFIKVRKFKFSDLSLSYQVRKKLYEMLISFDDNVNYEFEKQEIKTALIEILDQTETEVAYVINNVFRYDSNNDGVVTYEQFSNFCLEQHFGEMAIQRLHKTGLYVRGKQRVMSRNQFIKTVQYCLSFISVKPEGQFLTKIFTDLDLDRDDYITYSDYFTFLKEYFGSQSQSASVVTVSVVQEDLKRIYGNVDKDAMKKEIFKEKIQKKEEKKIIHQNKIKIISPTTPVVTQQIQSIKPTQQMIDLGQRISRLVYHQLKIITMQHDHKMTLCSNQVTAMELLSSIMRLSQTKASQIISEAFKNQATISYQLLVKQGVQRLMCQDLVQNTKYPLSKQKFISQILNSLHFVRIKPSGSLLEQLYDKCFNGKKEIVKTEFKNILDIIFNSYKWPRKTGELRLRSSMMGNSESHRFLKI